MQIATFFQKKTVRVFIRYFLGPLLFVWLSYSIYRQIISQPDLEDAWYHIQQKFISDGQGWIMGVVVILMLVNWSLETIKWKLCVKPVQPISFFTAFKAVLSGVSFSVSTPNRVGEYLGRILYMDEGNRMKAISLTILGSLSQLMITLLMGVVGLIFIRPLMQGGDILPSLWTDLIIWGTIAVLVILTLFYFRIAWLTGWLEKIAGLRRYVWLFSNLEGFNATLLLRLLSLSALRFVVFIAQYYLLFRLYDVEISWWNVWCATSVSFLVMAVIPTIALFTDLGLRGKINLKLLGLFSNNNLGISLASVSVWIINLLVPALAGSLLILSIKKVLRKK